MLVPDVLIWAGTFVLAVYFMDSAYDHNPFAPAAEQAEAIGYATILTWIRATGFMFLSAVIWLLLALETITLNNCDNAFGVCYTTATAAATTATIAVDPISKSLPYLFYGLFWFNLVVGIVITVWLALPNDQTKRLKTLFGGTQGQV